MERTAAHPDLEIERAILLANHEMAVLQAADDARQHGLEFAAGFRSGMSEMMKLDAEMYSAWTEAVDRHYKGGTNHG